VRASVYDVRGRLVRTLADHPEEPGSRFLSWDGLDRGGTRAASGLYFIRVEIGGASGLTKVVRIE
jgi:hypothetical protein